MDRTDIQRQRNPFPGRWVEQTFKGKGTHFLTVICGFCGYGPNRSTTAQPYTVFRQYCDKFNQLRVDGNEKNVTEPRQQMLNDLEERIRELKRENHEIILMADWNEDIHGRKISNFINKLELKEAILSQHGMRHAPSTHIEGSTLIDDIFTTRGISIQGSGYLAFSEGVKGKPDHREAWIDVTMTTTLGYKVPETIWPSMQRVTTKDMRSVQEFNKAMRAFVLSHQLGERITKLESTTHYLPTAGERQEAETLMQLRMEGI
jgi:hypothetical protein